MNLSDSTILITGASQGIGRHLGVHFAPKCRKIILWARNPEGLAETHRMIEKAGGVCVTFIVDLTDLSAMQAAVDALAMENNTVNILINNAADVTSKPILETSPAEIDRLVATNVTGPLQLCRLLLPDMIEHGDGVIVNISSLAGYKANPTQTVYSVTKKAVNGMSEALRAEVGGKGIHVMNVALASVATGNDARPGQVSAAEFAAILEQAIVTRKDELFLSSASKWLMRLYAFLPGLTTLRKAK